MTAPTANPTAAAQMSGLTSTGRAVTLLVDDDGKVHVNLGGATIEVDLLTIDIAALIQGIANGKTLADVVSALGSVAVTGPLTAAQLTTAALATEATLDAIKDALGSVPVTGPLTAAQLTTAALATAARQDTAQAALDALVGAGYTFVTPLPFVANDEAVELLAADPAKQVHVLGYMIDEIEVGVTGLKLMDTAAEPNLVHDFGAFAGGGNIERPQIVPVRPYHSVIGGEGLVIECLAEGCRGTILLATTPYEPEE